MDAIRLAKDAECSTALIQSAERCLNSALAEVKLLGAVTVCKVDGCVARCVCVLLFPLMCAPRHRT